MKDLSKTSTADLYTMYVFCTSQLLLAKEKRSGGIMVKSNSICDEADMLINFYEDKNIHLKNELDRRLKEVFE